MADLHDRDARDRPSFAISRRRFDPLWNTDVRNRQKSASLRATWASEFMEIYPSIYRGQLLGYHTYFNIRKLCIALT